MSRKHTERIEEMDMIVYLIRFDKSVDLQEYYKIAGWIRKKWGYDKIINGLWEIDYKPLIRGNGFKGIYGYLQPLINIIYFEKRAELSREKHKIPEKHKEPRKSEQESIDEAAQEMIKKYEHLFSLRRFLSGGELLENKKELIKIKDKLEGYGYENVG